MIQEVELTKIVQNCIYKLKTANRLENEILSTTNKD